LVGAGCWVWVSCQPPGCLFPQPPGCLFPPLRLPWPVSFLRRSPMLAYARAGTDLPAAGAFPVVEATLSAVGSFLASADTARNRRAEEAGPALLRALRDIWRAAPVGTVMDLERACERLLFPTPEVRSSRSSDAGSQRGGRAKGGYGGAQRGSRSRGGDDYDRPRDPYSTYTPHQGRYEAPPAREWVPPPQQRQAQAPATHEDRCVHCQGEHLSQRCFTKFPNLRPPRS
jgi:hypothetical protein